MCDPQWQVLAEFHLCTKECLEEIYCLCSRVFVESIDGDCEVQSEDDFLKTEEDADDQYDKHAEIESVSCYCSASHTDNISTDEHDSIRDSHATNFRLVTSETLHLSDSGADLSEGVSTTTNQAWERYWALNGERLIWESWITKYSAYINPEFLQSGSTEPQETEESLNEEKQELINSLKLSFEDPLSPHHSSNDCHNTLEFNFAEVKENEEQKLMPSVEVVEKNRILVRNLSGSESYDKLSREIEGWNPLSPVSNDYEIEAERLLGSRCASRTGSLARTVDSMTNVTRITVSSFDLSESSKNSDSFSSVSSVQSSLTSTSSEDIDDTADYEQQWNILWSQHYEEEYLKHYKKFLLENVNSFNENIDETAEFVDNCNVEESVLVDLFNSSRTVTNDLSNSNIKYKRRRGKARKVGVDIIALSSILNSIQMEDFDCSNTANGFKLDADISNGIVDNIYREEIHQMRALGLPVSFKLGNYQDVNKISTKISSTSFQDHTKQLTSKHIKGIFNLIGIEMDASTNEKFVGYVNINMKGIHNQNNSLKLRKHIHFDDDGYAIPEEPYVNEVTVQNSHQDELLGINQSSSAEDKELESIDETATSTDDNCEVKKNKRRRRKRKSTLPLEIKRNAKLQRFWNRRYSLFSKFDEGIKLDEESWFSVTPELIAQNTAERCKCDIIVDAFCGAGGNTIQFALKCNKVIAIDIDPQKIKLAQNNAEIYGVTNRIEFIIGDFFQLANGLKADVVFLSPPWGGLNYKNQKEYDLELLQPAPFTKLIDTAKKISPNISLFLPKNSNTYPLLKAAGLNGQVEIEQNCLDNYIIAITAYYGNLIKEVLHEQN